jgi:hypothetical protein
VLETLNGERFLDQAPAQVHATLLDEGTYLCSPRTMYRLLEAAGKVKERRDQVRRPHYAAPELLATRPNEVWSWDITKLLGPVKLTRCIYCHRLPDGEEHWLPRSFGAFRGNSLLKGRICTECNARLGRTLDQELIRTGHTGMTRQLLGISGRSGQPSANVFEYKAAQLEKPIEAESASIVPGQLIPIQAIGRNPDGTLKSIQQRTLTIATTEGERVLVFPRAWGATQLRDAAAARGLLGGKVIRAHAAPPETAAEFVAVAFNAIREVFGSGPIDIYQTRLDAPMGETEYRRVRFNLTGGPFDARVLPK